ncbi:MAG: hypothetical protein Q8S13_08690 [Dehalococcoidia bacterium]|nr:hypothetical protein [Dehalococcoidia bacterium]
MASNSKFARAARSCRHRMPGASSAAVFRCIKATGGTSSSGRRRTGGSHGGASAAQRRLAAAARSCRGKTGRAFPACVSKRIKGQARR